MSSASENWAKWRAYRKQMGWWEWFFPKCLTCLAIRFFILLKAFDLYYRSVEWPMVGALLAAAMTFAVVGSAANYMPPLSTIILFFKNKGKPRA